jgi:hypothetical protein
MLSEEEAETERRPPDSLTLPSIDHDALVAVDAPDTP